MSTAVVCKLCGKEMTLLDEENQRWYCYKDDIVFYWKEQRWIEGKAAKDRRKSHVALLNATSDDVKIAKRRFRANMRGYCDEKDVQWVEELIVKAERKAKTPGQVIEELKKQQDFHEATRRLGQSVGAAIGGGVVGGVIGIVTFPVGVGLANIGHARAPVPLFGPLTSKEEEWVSRNQPDEVRLLRAIQTLASRPTCQTCNEPMYLLDEDIQRWYCKKDDKVFVGGNGWKKTSEEIERDKQLVWNTTVKTEMPTQGVPQLSATKEFKFCRHCGAKIPRDGNYCEECGTNRS